MAKRRHTLNPAKVKRDAKALERAADRSRPRAPLRLGRRLTVALLGALTVVLLFASFAPVDLWFLAYVCLVPWTLALTLAPTRRWALLSAWLAGLAFWAVSLYWLTWVTLVGYFAGIAYLSLFWLAAAAVLRAAMGRDWPMSLVLPVVWVGLEYLRAHVTDLYLGPSFPWFLLAHTQYARTHLIQIADLAGQYGVSFFVGMVNGLGLDLLLGLLLRQPADRAKRRRRLLRGGVAVASTAAALLLYGAWRLSQETRSDGPVIGLVQRAFPISLGGREATAEEILDSHLAGSAKFVGARPGPDLVIWPETMLPRGINAEVLGVDVASLRGKELRGLAERFFGRQVWREDLKDKDILAYLRPRIEGGAMPDGEEAPGRRPLAGKVKHMAERLGCAILAGGATFHRNARPVSDSDRWVERNGVVWFEPGPDANNAPVYAKRHLVPFSEYVPFKRSWLGLHGLLRRFVPDVMPQLDPGPEWTRFVVRRPGGPWRLVSPICYEGTFADVCRAMVYDGRKRADIIANLSNDGWFIWSRNRRLQCTQCGCVAGDAQATVCPRCRSTALRTIATHHRSTEHAQHLSHYCFRAVECRVPVVRAVNTGISASIDSNGRIVAEVRHGRTRTMIPGTLLLDGKKRNDVEYLPGHGPKVLVDGRVSWYSRVGNLFAAVVGAFAAALAVRLAWKRPRKAEEVTN